MDNTAPLSWDEQKYTVFLSGVGAGAGSSIFGFLTRSTLPEERAGIFAAIMACRQAGLLIGQFLSSLSHLSSPCSVFWWNIRHREGSFGFDVRFDLRGEEAIQQNHLGAQLVSCARPPFVLSLKLFLPSLQARRSTCSCGCVISNWGPLLWTSTRLLG